jgi:hypothetical protein
MTPRPYLHADVIGNAVEQAYQAHGGGLCLSAPHVKVGRPGSAPLPPCFNDIADIAWAVEGGAPAHIQLSRSWRDKEVDWESGQAILTNGHTQQVQGRGPLSNAQGCEEEQEAKRQERYEVDTHFEVGVMCSTVCRVLYL